MFINAILFSGLFWIEINCHVASNVGNDRGNHNCDCWCWEPVPPEPEWTQKYQTKFDQLNVTNFSVTAAHMLHGLTIESAMISLNIKLPIQNGIPSLNANLSADESDAILPNIPSRPSRYSSAGMYGFVESMDHITDPNWMIKGSMLDRLAHSFHMQEYWAVARKAADDFVGVSEDICIGALDHANNGIEKTSIGIFTTIKNDSVTHSLTWDDNGESWSAWKASLSYHYVRSERTRSMGLYTHCLMRKFPLTEQPIDVCCDSKTVGEYSYTKVSTGEVPSKCLNNCIYSRDDKPGSKYCFGIGEEKVHCLD